MPYVLWVIATITILGSILNVKKIAACFVLWTICNVFWLIYDSISGVYSRALLDAVNLTTSTWGMISWFKK